MSMEKAELIGVNLEIDGTVTGVYLQKAEKKPRAEDVLDKQQIAEFLGGDIDPELKDFLGV